MGTAESRERWGRLLAVSTAVVLVVSSVFPLGAGLVKNPEAFPKWWGRVDVGAAFLLAALTLAVMALAGSKFSKPVEETTYGAYRVLIHGV